MTFFYIYLAKNHYWPLPVMDNLLYTFLDVIYNLDKVFLFACPWLLEMKYILQYFWQLLQKGICPFFPSSGKIKQEDKVILQIPVWQYLWSYCSFPAVELCCRKYWIQQKFLERSVFLFWCFFKSGPSLFYP